MPEAPDAATDLGVLSSTGLWQAAGDGTSQHAFMLALEGAGPGRGCSKQTHQTQEASRSWVPSTSPPGTGVIKAATMGRGGREGTEGHCL